MIKKIGFPSHHGSALLICWFAVLVPDPVQAHEHREVGGYEFRVGWQNEPAYAGQPNAVTLAVSRAKKPVKDLEKHLRLEISFGGQRRTLELRPHFRESGQYLAFVLPTREGDYQFRFFGKIGEQSIEQTFDSTQGEFSGVRATQPIEFPEKSSNAPAPTIKPKEKGGGSETSARADILGWGALFLSGLAVVVAFSRRRK
ncbi:MAG: hypothetical protein HY645_14320 [Acidobacteria bacterium]|nr:hypothetical protein [Acidobacteriota bacterium]